MVTIAQQNKIEQLDDFVVESAKDVFATMLNWPLETTPRTMNAAPRTFQLKDVNGYIGFAGSMMGSIFFSCSEKLNLEMARGILGQEYGPGARELSEVIGELTNMLAGSCKSHLSDHGTLIVMSIPNVIRGKDIKAATRDVTFMLEHCFALPMIGESFKVITLGKFD